MIERKPDFEDDKIRVWASMSPEQEALMRSVNSTFDTYANLSKKIAHFQILLIGE